MAAEIRRSIKRPAHSFEDVIAAAKLARAVARPLLKDPPAEFTSIHGEQGNATAVALDAAVADAQAAHIEPVSLTWSMTEPPDTVEVGLDIWFGVGVTDFRLLNRTVEVTASGRDLGKVLAMHDALTRAFAAEDEVRAFHAQQAEQAERERAASARDARWLSRFRQQSPTMMAGIVSGVASGLVVGVVMLFVGIAVGKG